MSHNNNFSKQQADDELTPKQRTQLYVDEGDRRGLDGDFRGALSEYKKAAALIPSSRALSRLAEGYAANDQPYKAIEFYQRALQSAQVYDEDRSGHEDLSDAHIGLGDLCCSFALSATAIRSYERAVRSRPQNPYYRWKLAIALAAVGLYEKSARQMEVVLEMSPDDAFYHFQLADIYLLMHRFEEGIDEFQKSVLLAPRDEYYRLRLGAALLQSNRCQEAISQFASVIDLNPDNASYHALYHYAQVRNGDQPQISFEVAVLNLGAYDDDFVRRFYRLSQPTVS